MMLRRVGQFGTVKFSRHARGIVVVTASFVLEMNKPVRDRSPAITHLPSHSGN
jgi:hypothetical protein